jgi:hypothetical protein
LQQGSSDLGLLCLNVRETLGPLPYALGKFGYLSGERNGLLYRGRDALLIVSRFFPKSRRYYPKGFLTAPSAS